MSEKIQHIMVIGLNPAIDLTGKIDVILKGKVNSINSSYSHAAGKGLNVAHVLSKLGANVTLTGFIGKENADIFTRKFQALNLQDETIKVNGATRINVKLVEENSEVTDLNFPGFCVTQDDIDALEIKIFSLLSSHDYFVFSGSVPPNFPIEKLSQWIQKLTSLNKKVVLDSSKDALKHGINAKPWLIKPNLDELAQWADELVTNDNTIKITQRILNLGVSHVVLSKGAEGLLWVNKDNILSSKPPKMDIVSTVGAGDTLVAGLCWSFMQQYSPEKTLTFVTALSALAVTQIGVGEFDNNTLIEVENQVVITQHTH